MEGPTQNLSQDSGSKSSKKSGQSSNLPRFGLVSRLLLQKVLRQSSRVPERTETNADGAGSALFWNQRQVRDATRCDCAARRSGLTIQTEKPPPQQAASTVVQYVTGLGKTGAKGVFFRELARTWYIACTLLRAVRTCRTAGSRAGHISASRGCCRLHFRALHVREVLRPPSSTSHLPQSQLQGCIHKRSLAGRLA